MLSIQKKKSEKVLFWLNQFWFYFSHTLMNIQWISWKTCEICIHANIKKWRMIRRMSESIKKRGKTIFVFWLLHENIKLKEKKKFLELFPKKGFLIHQKTITLCHHLLFFTSDLKESFWINIILEREREKKEEEKNVLWNIKIEHATLRKCEWEKTLTLKERKAASRSLAQQSVSLSLLKDMKRIGSKTTHTHVLI